MKQANFLALCEPELSILLKMCTLRVIRIRPALRGFVGGRCARGCTSLYHSAIFERVYPDENAAQASPNTACSFAGVSAPRLPLQKRTQRLVCAQVWGRRQGGQRFENVTLLHPWEFSSTTGHRVLLRRCRDSSWQFSVCVLRSQARLPEYGSLLH